MNTHGRPDVMYEMHATWRDGFLGYVVSGGVPSPSANLTIAPFATKGYVAEGQELVFVDQPAPSQGHTLTQGAGTYYVGMARNTTSTIAGWGRWAGTHYVTYFGIPATLLADGVTPLCRLTVTPTAITAVDPQPFAQAVRMPNGLALSGDPLAPTVGTTLPVGLGLYVQASMICDPPTFTVDSVAHRVGVGTAAPAYTLDVVGEGRLTRLGLNTAPDAGYALTSTGPMLLGGGNIGIGGVPTELLDVFGRARLQRLGLSTTPDNSYALVASGSMLLTGGNVGLGGVPVFLLDVFGAQRVQKLGVVGNPHASYDLFVSGTAAKPGGSTWTDSNSMRLYKQDIQPLTGALATLLRLRGRTWRWAAAYPELEALLPGRQVGLVIDEIAPVLPQWVTTAADGTQSYTERGTLAYLIEALREVVQRLEALEAPAG